MSLLTTDFANDLADIIVGDIQLKHATWYHFLGKSAGYASGSTIPERDGSQKEKNEVRAEQVYYKKVQSNSVSRVIRRVNWQQNAKYDRWDHTQKMKDKNFYVISEVNGVYRVYKCLDNNPARHVRQANSNVSVIRPFFTGPDPVRFLETEMYNAAAQDGTVVTSGTLGDGYLWKYMYEIAPSKMRQFGNFIFVPTQRALSDSFYNRGQIENVLINNPGSGYADFTLTTVNVTDTGATAGSGASAQIGTINAATGTILTIATPVHSAGLGHTPYTKGVRITINQEWGRGAVLEPVLNVNGWLTAITVVSGGIGYTADDNITIAVGGAKVALAIAKEDGTFVDGTTVKKGEIIKCQVIDSGIGYSSVPAITVQYQGIISPVPSGKYGTHTSAILQGVVDAGKLVKVVTIDPGINYPSNSATTIVVNGDGKDASMVPIIDQGQIIDIVVNNAGEGYTNISLSVNSTTVTTPAELEAVINSSDYTSDQSYIEQMAVSGGLYAGTITNGGTGYTDSRFITVNISGDGFGAKAKAVVYDGVIIGVEFNEAGQGYTYANLTFTDSQRDNSNVALVAAAGYAITSPIGGHGQNAPKELFQTGVALYSSFRIGKTLNYIDQEYRLYGLVRNPKDVYKKQMRADEELAAYQVVVTSGSAVINDDVLVMSNQQAGTIKFRVLNVAGNELILLPLGNRNITPSGEMYREVNTGDRFNVISVNDAPIIDRNSGDLVFFTYEQPFEFSENQGIIIKTYLNLENVE